jgi:hypothetical protein
MPLMGTITCKFKDELQSKYSCFRKGRYEAEYLLCKPGTYVSAANKGSCDLKAHVECDKLKKAIRDEKVSARVTNFFSVSERKSDDTV